MGTAKWRAAGGLALRVAGHKKVFPVLVMEGCCMSFICFPRSQVYGTTGRNSAARNSTSTPNSKCQARGAWFQVWGDDVCLPTIRTSHHQSREPGPKTPTMAGGRASGCAPLCTGMRDCWILCRTILYPSSPHAHGYGPHQKRASGWTDVAIVGAAVTVGPPP
jgi:hypothetical protein